MTAPVRRCSVLAVVVVASLVAISVAQAAFTSGASVGSQGFTSASLSPPTAPSGVCSGHAAWIGWTATASTWADGYEVLRSKTNGGPYAHLATVSGQTTTLYKDTNLSGSAKWYYVVRATKGNWTSAQTAQVTVTSC